MCVSGLKNRLEATSYATGINRSRSDEEEKAGGGEKGVAYGWVEGRKDGRAGRKGGRCIELTRRVRRRGRQRGRDN